MAENLLEEYKAYYAVRAQKFEGNPKYANSYQAEKHLSDLMQSCAVLEEFKDKIGDANEKCAIGLVKDQSLMEKAHYDKHQEIIRVKASEKILENVDTCKDALDIATIVVEITNKNSIEISMDESHREFYSDWDQVDDITIYENAVVPDKYKQDMMNVAQETKQRLIDSILDLEKNHNEWEAGWKIIPEKNFEHRHRRLIPFKDEHIHEQLAKYKSIINR